MKRILAILLALMMLSAIFAVQGSARGYSVSVPTSQSAHNLEAYGLHTMEVYEADSVPTIDGKVGTGEYPGPNNGCSLSAVPGDNMWMSTFTTSATTQHQNNQKNQHDFTDFVLEEDKPEYINSYLTYDDEFLYFAVTTTIPAVRMTPITDAEPVVGSSTKRSPYWWIDTFVNFMQSKNVSATHFRSLAQNRYTLYKYDHYNTAQSASVVSRTYTIINEVLNRQYITGTYPNYVDADGLTWNATTYKRPENFYYQVTVLENGKWAVTFEGRQPLGDVLRITDVEYEDGTPIDYVPEWGTWGVSLRLQSTGNNSALAPNGQEMTILRDDVYFAQTMLPAYGTGTTGANSKVGGYLFTNTLSSSIESNHGLSVQYLCNPVHFMGKYDETFDYDSVYSSSVGKVVNTTSRVTRTRTPVLTSGVRGVNYRVIGVATAAASATGDSVSLTIVLAATMILCAATAVCVVLMKKRSSRA